MKKINIAELIKDCPTGMELDCTMYEDVYFDYVDELKNIHCYIQQEFNKTSVIFNQDGTPTSHTKSKCVIFPKYKTTWEGFVPPCKFKTGDVLFVDCSDDEDKSYQYIFILNDPEFYGKWHSYCHLDGVGCFHSEETYLTDEAYHPRFATEEEKKELFDAIKKNGYKWNPETKTLEKVIEPKFKVGDKVIHSERGGKKLTINGVYKTLYGVEEFDCGIPIENQDEYELAPNKFDITTLQPFDKVLVRGFGGVWGINIFGFYDGNNKECPFYCIGQTATGWNQCVPYWKNEHLLGTANDCDEYYKTWE